MSSDPINPKHYKRDGIECINAIKAALVDGFPDYLRGNVLKYLWRYKERNGAEDLRKARQYLEWLIEESETTVEASGANETLIAPPKRYRDPTKDDLANGPIKCEYRDFESEQWRSGLLVYILNGSCTFLCVSEERELSGQWLQCRIEAGE